LIYTVILYVFIIATVIQLAYWLLLFSKLAFYKTAATTVIDVEQPVSIIICAKNEAENLKKNLPRILNQNYHSYEVIVVNDNSNDQTGPILLDFMLKNNNLHIINKINTQNLNIGKKFALSIGINAAKHKVLLLTDADCTPNSREWLREMQKNIQGKTEIGLGYGPYDKEDGFLNKFIRFETVYTAIQYLSFALARMPYMGVGRNLVYKKSLFHKVNGFTKHEHIASGDDDLFINEVAHGENTKIVLKRETFVYSIPQKSWKSYFRQKSRHMTTGKHYQLKHKALLGLLSLSHILHYFGGIVLILKFSTMFAVITLYVLRILVLLIIYKATLNKLHETHLLKWVPILDLVFVLYYIILSPALAAGKTNRWK